MAELDAHFLARLSDAELVALISETCLESHRLTGRLLVYLGEVEERRLDLRAGCSSMFDFCTRLHGMSEGVAHRRIVGARLVRRFPRLLGPIERGELHLSTLVLLRPHLTEETVDAFVARVRGMTHREVEELLARIAPRPDVPSRIRALHGVPLSTNGGSCSTAGQSPSSSGLSLPLPSGVSSSPHVQSLAEPRFAVQLTASQALRDKLERARDLMRHRNPNGDLAVVVERALDLLLVRLEKERLAKTRRPRACPSSSSSSSVAVDAERMKDDASARRYVPRAVRREVFERDGEQCTFVAPDGARCPARTLLELDHLHPKALGGTEEAANLRVRCRAHNRLHAEEIFGKELVARRRFRCRKSDDADAAETPAMRGLLHLGFARAAAARALEAVERRHAMDPAPLPVATLLREAVATLT